MMQAGRNQRGVALLMVMAAITVLSALAIQFSYDSRVVSQVATTGRDRLKAFYLAKSSYNFMLLELKYDKTFRQVVQSQNLSQYLGKSAQLPLCQQFPLSTGLIRLVFLEGGSPGQEEAPAPKDLPPEEPEKEKEKAKKGEEGIDKMQAESSISQAKQAQEFLKFDGDFDGQCIDEGTKISLNGFAGLSAAPAVEGQPSPVDQYKLFLIKYLSRPETEEKLKQSNIHAIDVVNNIADWIDADSTGSRGSEQGPYDKLGVSYKVHDRKLLTLQEVYMIDGVGDEWFTPLIDKFTIYGDGKINVCTASPDIVEGLIRRYVDSTPGLPPLRLEQPEEMMRLTDAVMLACAGGTTGDQLKQQLSSSMTAAIGALASGTPSQPVAPSLPAPGAPAAAPADTGFEGYVTTTSRYFTLNLAGQVNDAGARIKAVIDVKEQDPKKWKLMYWRVY